jgi:hypothetical protein
LNTEDPLMAATSHRTWLQFSLRTILWVMLCAAIGIAAYRWGYDAGVVDQKNQRQQVGNVYAMVYYVGDMTPGSKVAAMNSGPQVDLERLIGDLTAEVLPNTWADRGGAAAIKEFATNQVIVISHDQDGHQRIAKYLERRRREKTIPMLSAN